MNASVLDPPDPTGAVWVFPSQLLTVEVLRRPVESTRHTSYDAFLRGFEVVVPADATAVFQPLSQEAVQARQERALDYLRTFYGVNVVRTADLLSEAGATPSDPSRAAEQK